MRRDQNNGERCLPTVWEERGAVRLSSYYAHVVQEYRALDTPTIYTL